MPIGAGSSSPPGVGRGLRRPLWCHNCRRAIRERRGSATIRTSCTWCSFRAVAGLPPWPASSSSSPAVSLTIVINGYDDGASTGEVRRFLGDSLGPSDFRKNASNLAATLHTCAAELIELLDLRMPVPCTRPAALALLRALGGAGAVAGDAFAARASFGCSRRCPRRRGRPSACGCSASREEVESSGRPFDFDDCSLGNLVFAGGFLLAGARLQPRGGRLLRARRPAAGLIENVTDGTNAYLVALDGDGRLLATEEAIVDAARPNRIRDIFLVDRPLDAGRDRGDRGRGRVDAAAGSERRASRSCS